MFTRLDTAIPVYVLEKRKKFAMAVINYGQEHNLIRVKANNETGEIWCAPDSKVHMDTNWTKRRSASAKVLAKSNG